MIWLCGDTHGEVDLFKVEDFFEEISCYQTVTKADCLIILGDVGCVFSGGGDDEYTRERLHRLPCTVLWLDGNHENFDLLAEYPITEDWNGGKVQFIEEDIIHLMRGQVYTLEGKKFFVFGGGFSIDKAHRIPGYTWWPQEMPSEREYEEGRRNLECVGYAVDYILTHTCPSHVAHLLVHDVHPGEEELQEYFDDISQEVEFFMWYFGHWHMDQTEDRYRCLMYDVVELEDGNDALCYQ